MEDAPTVERLRAEYHRGAAFGIGERAPRLSWITTTSAPGWTQAAYEIEIDGTALGRVDSDGSVFVAWPGAPLSSRQRHRVRVRVWGADGSASTWSEPLDVEAGLLDAVDWSASWITSSDPADQRPQRFRRSISIDRRVASGRLYITSAGVHQVVVNGQRVGDHALAPGWTTYGQRLHYDTHDVTGLLSDGENVLGAAVADGWWRGYLWTFGQRAFYGDQIGLLAQLEVTFDDGTVEVIATDGTWRAAPGPWDAADLYNGETYDARRADDWSRPGYDDDAWAAAVDFAPKVGVLVAPVGPPVRRIEERPVVEVLTTPSGRTILDFGQNLVGWVRLTVEGEAGTTVTLRHAEVLEHGELCTRTLRTAQATDRYILGGGDPETWEPCFTFHGFRYAEVDGLPGPIDPEAFTAVVIHSDLERTGTLSCSHELLNQLHRNVTWGMRGNVVDVPTDCPQRDERLGWTGDVQLFAPTATFLYDAGGFLADWLADLVASQREDGAVPLHVPSEPLGPRVWSMISAAWSDAATIVPSVLYERYGDLGLLARQFESMRGWVDFARAKCGDPLVWPEEFQLGDWLDPVAPPEQPWRTQTDAILVATAYVARSAQLTAEAAALLGDREAAEEYGQLAVDVRRAFREQYVAPSGRISSDSQTAYALAIVFDLYETHEQRAHGGARLAQLAAQAQYRIATGFVGTPIVLPALRAVGDTTTAYRLLTETACPSWLYPVTMGATTVWERWDSMLPDGSINPGRMTSFNHCALGSVADWMHQVIGGIAPAAPGYRRLRFAPVPGPGVTSADCALLTPYGHAACRWSVDGTSVSLEVKVPPNTSGVVVPPGTGTEHAVAAGTHRWSYVVTDHVVEAWADPPSARPSGIPSF